MRKLCVSMVIAGALFGLAACSGGSGSTTSASDRVRDDTNETVPQNSDGYGTDSWSPAMETVVIGLIRQQPDLDGYEPSCVLDQIETEYDTPQDYIDAAKSSDASIGSVAVAVYSRC